METITEYLNQNGIVLFKKLDELRSCNLYLSNNHADKLKISKYITIHIHSAIIPLKQVFSTMTMRIKGAKEVASVLKKAPLGIFMNV